MRVFVTGTGRCGTVTCSKAFSHATNYTVGHESHAGRIADWDYPDQHIEVSAQLVDAIPILRQRYPEAYWIHLLRLDHQSCIRSMARLREACEAYAFLHFQARPQSEAEYLAVAEAWHAHCLRQCRQWLPRERSIVLHLEEVKTHWPIVWDDLGCEGDLAASLKEWDVRYNSTAERIRETEKMQQEMERWNRRDWPFPEQPWPDDFLEGVRRFFAADDLYPYGKDVYQHVFRDPTVFPLQRSRELGRMIRMARQIKPRRVMEIGADKGGTFYHWIKCLPKIEQAVALEIRGCPYAEEFERHFPAVRFCWIEESSHSDRARATVQSFLDGPLDVLFLDGDKARYLDDFRAYAPLVRPGGLIFVHDIFDEPVAAAWETIAATHRTETIVDRSEGEEAAAREREGLPVTSPHEGWLRHWRGRSCCIGVVHV